MSTHSLRKEPHRVSLGRKPPHARRLFSQASPNSLIQMTPVNYCVLKQFKSIILEGLYNDVFTWRVHVYEIIDSRSTMTNCSLKPEMPSLKLRSFSNNWESNSGKTITVLFCGFAKGFAKEFQAKIETEL